MTVPQDIRWGRTYEGFCEDPGAGDASWARRRCAACRAPTWPIRWRCWRAPSTSSATAARRSASAQDGKGLDQGDTRVDEATLRRIHLPGYIAAIKAGVGTIMPSYSSWNGVKCSASKRLLTEILKQELGFEGFLISDYNAIDQITPDYKEAIAHLDQRRHGYGDGARRDIASSSRNLKALVDEGKVPMSRIDDAVTRILRVKFAMGMMEREPLAAGGPQAAEELRLGGASQGRAAGGARVDGAAEE